MYQKFTVTELRIDEANHCVIATFSHDLEEKSINKTSVYITESSSEEQPILNTTYAVEGQVVKIFYPDFKVNTQYTFYANNRVKSVTDMSLEIEYIRAFTIRSSVDSSIAIISPADYEEITESVPVKLQESPGKSGKTVGKFRLQIATDVIFQDLVYDSVLEKSELSINKGTLKQNGQYYLRARAERTVVVHGNWSDIVTFTINYQSEQRKEDPEESEKPDSTSQEEPTFIDDLELVAYPENGVTPSSFIFEFNSDLDPNIFKPENVMIIKRRI